jgi:hypothetical protein
METHLAEVETDGLNPQHPGVINAWGGAILRGEPLVADGREGIRGLTLSNAMHLSSWQDKAVEIPFDDEVHYELLMGKVNGSKKKENVKAVVADVGNTFQGTHQKRWNTNW